MSRVSVSSLVIGGGLAGIAVASALHKRGEPFLLLEAEPRLGGKIESTLTPEACLERGPNSFTAKSLAILELIADLGLSTDLLEAAPVANKRYILKHGRITRLPSGPKEIFSTCALSFVGKCRFLSEALYVPRRRTADESVYQFFTRHFGDEVARYIADPFVSGIFAGDPQRLAAAETFPKMCKAEDMSGSILRYLVREKKTGAVAPRSYTLRGGLAALSVRAHEKWRDAMHVGERVIGIKTDAGGFCVQSDKAEYECVSLYVTVPAYAAASLFKENFSGLADSLSRIEYPEVVTAHVKVRKTERYPFDGFGVLIPSCENRPLLGVLWNSSAFPELFPDREHHYLTVYCGGARGKAVVKRPDAELWRIILSELQSLFRLETSPVPLGLKRHARAIPQYTRDYALVKPHILSEAAKIPGLHLAGNYLGGISMPDTAAYAVSTALEG